MLGGKCPRQPFRANGRMDAEVKGGIFEETLLEATIGLTVFLPARQQVLTLSLSYNNVGQRNLFS